MQIIIYAKVLLLSKNKWATNMFATYLYIHVIGIVNHFDETQGKKPSFCLFHTTGAKMYYMNIPYFGQCLCWITISRNNKLRETQLGRNLNVARAQIPSIFTGDWKFDHLIYRTRNVISVFFFFLVYLATMPLVEGSRL